MKSLLSYLLLVTLLFPTAVESFHAINDSHITQEDQALIYSQEKHDCNLGLYFATDFNDVNTYSYVDQINVFLDKENLKTSSYLISSLYIDDIKYRGPPQA
tara:strand:- start:6523 stop:6825 length:303 start_codon:yes stop_codon:yes gene_type:complete